MFQDSSQIGLLKELLDLQKDMVVMLLSLLEGSHKHITLPTNLLSRILFSSVFNDFQ